MIWIQSFALFIFTLTSLSADQNVTVTAEKISKDYEKSSSSIKKMDSQQIQDSGISQLDTLLKTRLGIHISTNGPIGQTSNVFIRGGNSENVLFIIDGIEVNDPISPARSFNPAHIGTHNIKSIEVIKGAQSVLYGSDSLSGVVLIKTKDGNANHLSLKYGSNNFFSQNAHFSGEAKHFNYQVYGGHTKVDGPSVYNKERVSSQNAEKDSYSRLSLDLKISKKFRNSSEIGAITKTEKIDYDYDFSTGDSSTAKISEDKLTYGLYYKKFFFDGLVHNKTSFDRHYVDRSDLYGESQKLSNESKVLISEDHSLIIGAEVEQDKGRSEDSFANQNIENKDIFISHFYEIHSLFSTLGIRKSFYKDRRDPESYQLGLGFSKFGTTLKASHTTGFKAPSIYQVFHPTYGNKNLKPTKNKSYEASLINKSKYLELEYTVFQNNYENVIEWEQVYQNIERSRTEGHELSVRSNISTFNLELSYSNLRAIDLSTKRYLARRPRQKLSAFVEHRLSDPLFHHFTYSYIGERNDLSSGSRMPSYSTLDYQISYSPSEDIQVTTSIENLLDKKYEEVRYYGTPGRSFYISLGVDL